MAAIEKADITLLFGVQVGDISSGSYGLIYKQLSGIVSDINKKPFEINFGVSEASILTMKQQLADIIQIVGKDNNVAINFNVRNIHEARRAVAGVKKEATETTNALKNATKASDALSTAEANSVKYQKSFNRYIDIASRQQTAQLVASKQNTEERERQLALASKEVAKDAELAALQRHLNGLIERRNDLLENKAPGPNVLNDSAYAVGGSDLKTAIKTVEWFDEEIRKTEASIELLNKAWNEGTFEPKDKHLLQSGYTMYSPNADFKQETTEAVNQYAAAQENARISEERHAQQMQVTAAASDKLASSLRNTASASAVADPKIQTALANAGITGETGDVIARAVDTTSIQKIESATASVKTFGQNGLQSIQLLIHGFDELGNAIDRTVVYKQKKIGDQVKWMPETRSSSKAITSAEDAAGIRETADAYKEVAQAASDAATEETASAQKVIMTEDEKRSAVLGTLKEYKKITDYLSQATNLGINSEAAQRLSEIADQMSHLSSAEKIGEMTKKEHQAAYADLSKEAEYYISILKNEIDTNKLVANSEAEIADIEKRITQNKELLKSAGGLNIVGDNVEGLQGVTSQFYELQERLSAGKITAREYAETYTKLISESGKYTAALRAEVSAAKASNKEQINKRNVMTESARTQNQIAKDIQKFSAAQYSLNASSRSAYERLGQLQIRLKDADTAYNDERITLQEYNEVVKTTTAEEQRLSSEIVNAGDNHMSFTNTVKRSLATFTGFFSTTRIIYAAIRAVRVSLKEVVDMESALTQLKIVTNATDTEMQHFASTAFELSKSLGQSVTDVVSSIETFSRLGYSLDESSVLSKYTSILANVAGVETSETTKGLTSIIKGYDLNIEDAEHVADVLIEVGQKYAISASELMEAFERSGAALHSTNVTFEKSAALLAAANASVQDASTVGTALKTVSARIRKSVSELEELGEDTSDLADGFSKYADEIKALTNVDIMLDKEAGIFKDLYDIFDEISNVWDKLSDTQQARVAEIFGGTRQLQVISSIIGNWGDAESALETASNAAGTAVKANDVYMESAAAHINQLKEAWQKLSYDLISTDVIKTVVDTGKTLLNILGSVIKIVDTLGGLPTLLASITASIAAVKLGGAVKNCLDMITALTGIEFSLLGVNAALGAAGLVITGVVALVSMHAKAEKERREQIEQTAEAAKQMLEGIDDETAALIEVTRQYEVGTATVLDYTTALEAEAVALGVTESRLQDIKNSTKDYTSALRDEIDSLLELRSVQLGAKANQSAGSLMNQYNGEWWQIWKSPIVSGGSNAGNTEETRNAYSALKALEAAGYISSSSYSSYSDGDVRYSQGFSFLTDLDTSNVDGVVNAYKELERMMIVVRDAGGTANFVYQALEERYNELTDSVTEYTSALHDFNLALVKSEYTQKALTEGIPDADDFSEYINSLARSVYENKDYTGSLQEAHAEVIRYIKTLPEFENLFDGVADKTFSFSERSVKSINDYTLALNESISSIQDWINNATKIQSVGDTAYSENFNGGLSVDSIKQIIELTDDWIDYLYVENGIIKLNTEAWNRMATTSSQGYYNTLLENATNAKTAIEEQISALERNIEAARRERSETDAMSARYDTLTRYIDSASASLAEYRQELASVGEKVEILSALSGELANSTDPLQSAFAGVDSVATHINSVTEAYSRLANIQQAVGDSFIVSLDKAMEFADVYPKILEGASVTADGQIQLNERVVNDLIAGEQASIEAATQAEIAKLQAQKDANTAKINMLKQVLEDMAKMNIAEAEQYGKTKMKEIMLEGQAAKALASSSANVADTIAKNHAAGSSAAAQNVGNAANSMMSTFAKVAESAYQTALQVAQIGTKNPQRKNPNTGMISINTTFGAVSAQIAKLEEANLEIDGLIAELQATLGVDLGTFNGNYGGASSTGGSGGGGSSSASSNSAVAANNQWFSRLNTYHEHLVETGKETEADYLKWLTNAYKEAYKQGEITLEEYWKYEEQVATGVKKIAEDVKSAFESVLKTTQAMIKQDYENQKDALTKKLSALKDYYDKQKDMLKEVADEEKYLREQSEKRKAVIDIQDQLDQLAYDDSAWAQKRRLELQEQLSEVSQDLDDFEKEHALNAALDELDNAYNTQAAAIQKEIDAIDAILNNPQALYNLALKELVENTGGLYKALVEYNKKYGDSEDDTVKVQWDAWYNANSEYNKTYGSNYNGVRVPNSTNVSVPTAPKTQNTVQYADSIYGTSLSNGSTIRVKASATNFGSKSGGTKLTNGVAGGSYTVYGVSEDGTEVLIGKNGVYTGWIKRSDIQGYRYGTSNATPGFHRVNEGGLEELIFSSRDGNSYRMLNGGDKVLTNKATNFLYDFANAGASILSSVTRSSHDRMSSLLGSSGGIYITMSPITINGSADEKTVSELRRAQRSALDETLKAFNRLNK